MTDNDMPVELFICYMPTGRGELMRIQATETQTVGSTKYIPEARHKELMERAVGEERLMSRIFALKDAKRNPAILDAMIESADRDIREYLKAAISTGEKA